MNTRRVEKLDLGLVKSRMKLYYFTLNLEKDIKDFNGWNFEWKMETKGDVKVRFSDNYTILH